MNKNRRLTLDQPRGRKIYSQGGELIAIYVAGECWAKTACEACARPFWTPDDCAKGIVCSEGCARARARERSRAKASDE